MSVGLLSLRAGYSPSSTGLLALNRADDLGVSNTDNISNYPKPPLVLTLSSDVSANAIITITNSGSTFLTHTLSIADYNAGGFSQSASGMADGSYTMGGSINDGSIINVIGFTYLLNTSITTPTLTGTSPAFVSNPSYTVTFGAVKPVANDILVLLIDNVFNNNKTLGSGDLSSTTISATGLAVGIYSATGYVYSPSGDNKFSQVSSAFSQIITNGDSYVYSGSANTIVGGNPVTATLDLGTHSGNFTFVIETFSQGGHPSSVTAAGSSITTHDLTGTGGDGWSYDIYRGTLTSGQGGPQSVSVTFASPGTVAGFAVWTMEGLSSGLVSATMLTTRPQLVAVNASDIVIGLSHSPSADFSDSVQAPIGNHTVIAGGVVSADWLMFQTGNLSVSAESSVGAFGAGVAVYR